MTLDEKVKQFLGVYPYDGPTNYVRGDGYFYNSLVKQYGQKAVDKAIESNR